MVTSGRMDFRDQFPSLKFPLFDKCQNMDSYMIHAFLAPSPSVCTIFTVYGATTKPLTLSFSRTRSKLQAWKRCCFCRRCVDKSMVVRIKVQRKVCWVTKTKFNLRSRWPLAVLFWWTHYANTVLVWRMCSHCTSSDPPWATHWIDVAFVTTGDEQTPPCPSLFPFVSGEEPDVKGDYSVTYVFKPTCRSLRDTWSRPRRKSQHSARPPSSCYSRERIGTSHEGLFWADKIIMWIDPTREPLGAA